MARVLLVDDERPNLDLLAIMLAPEGFELVTAASGEEALASVARQPPDAILLDVMMPGMNGHQVAAAIKGNAATKHIAIAMITGHDDPQTRSLAMKAGADDFLCRPVDPTDLCLRVRALLSRAAAAAANVQSGTRDRRPQQ
jgi:DNA-binding response OmpR family regulator